MAKRKYAENRDPKRRILSRRAYYERNKIRINAQKRERRARCRLGEADRLDLVVQLARKAGTLRIAVE